MTDLTEYIKRLEKEVKDNRDKAYDAETMARLLEVSSNYEGSDRVITSEELIEQIKQRPEEVKMFSSFKGIDDILNGFRQKQLVVLAAPTKNGKTSFAMDLTSQMREYNPLWFPLEEGGDELVTKYMERGEQPPHFCLPMRNINGNTQWVEERIIEAVVKYNAKIVFIDHLHFIVPFDNKNAERQDLRIGAVMRELKAIARRWNVCIILIAHLKKTKLDSQPDLEDLRDSSFIAQEADTVIMLWRETKRVHGEIEITNNVNVSVQANRRTGKTGNIKMVYDNGHFIERAWEDKDLEKSFPTAKKTAKLNFGDSDVEY